MTIEPRQLFSAHTLDYPVKTRVLGKTNYVNLDNAATTPPLISVTKAVDDFLVSYGSVHRGAGTKSKLSTEYYERSREIIKKFVGAPHNSYVLFGANTTGAMNALAYFMAFLPGKIAVSSLEHSSSWLSWVKAEGVKAVNGETASLSEIEKLNQKIQSAGHTQVLQYGINEQMEIDFEELEEMLKHNEIKAVVVTASSNLTGYCPDLGRVSGLVHQYGAYVVVDGCQYIQHHAIDMAALGIDFLIASGHKLYAPYGTGFTVGPKDFFDAFLPYQIGGGNLPYIATGGEFIRATTQLAHDPGTPNSVGAIAIAAALETLAGLGMDTVAAYENDLAHQAYVGLKNIPGLQVHVPVDRLQTIISFSIRGKDPRVVAERLNADFGIGVRAGSFCVYQAVRNLLKLDPNDGDIAAGVRRGDLKAVPAVVRASFGLTNDLSDVGRLIVALNLIAA